MATVRTVVTIKTDQYYEDAAIRQAISAAQEVLTRNPKADAVRLSLATAPKIRYQRAKVTLTFRLVEDI